MGGMATDTGYRMISRRAGKARLVPVSSCQGLPPKSASNPSSVAR